MSIYAIHITDCNGYGGTAKFKANNKTEARTAARQYIRAWRLAPATIDNITKEAAR